MTPDQIIEENGRRLDLLLADYDPLLGDEHSPVERFELQVSPNVRLRLPLSMRDEPCVRAFDAGPLPTDAEWFEAVAAPFDAVRRKHDFEFWCATRVLVKNRSGQVVPLLLNHAQRAILAGYEQQRLAGEPVRASVLKSRRLGCTTVTYAYVAWHQAELYTGRDAWFMGLDKAGSQEVRERYDVIRERCGLTFRNLDQTGTTRRLVERGCDVSVGSVERPNAPSGRDAHYVHLFEIGKWPSNVYVSAERVAQNMEPMCPEEPGTVFVMESSAQGGIGTYFKGVCDTAMAGTFTETQRPYTFLFVGVPHDVDCLRGVEDYEAFVATLTDEELSYFVSDGATLEHIQWRRWQAMKPGFHDAWRLAEEYPFNAREAFQTGEKRVFHPLHVMALRKTCTPPVRRGRLVGRVATGPESLLDIRFEPDARGPLSVWHEPGDAHGLLQVRDGLLRPIRHRYAMATDVGGIAQSSDPHCSRVLDRAPRLFKGRPTIAAELHGRGPFYEWAWEAARLGTWYHEAYWAMEENSIRARLREQQGPGAFEAFLAEIGEHYDNLYLREVINDETKEVELKIGFQTNSHSKALAIGELQKAMWAQWARLAGEAAPDDAGYVERGMEACAEMDEYIIDGVTMEAAPKKLDDRVMTTAILAHLEVMMRKHREVAYGPWPGDVRPVRGRPGGMAIH